MARFAIIVPPLTGHVNPTLGLGAELLRRRQEVGWISVDTGLRDRLPAGGELLPVVYDAADPEGRQNGEYVSRIAGRDVYGIESIKFLYEEVLMPLNRYMYKGIGELLDNYVPDVVIHDQQLFAGAIAAYRRKIPYVTSVTAPAAVRVREDLPGVYAWEQEQVLALQQELGVRGSRYICHSELLTLLYTSREFFGEGELPAHYAFVGPMIREGGSERGEGAAFDWELFHRMGMEGRPRILISIGTTFDHQYKKDFLGKVIDAFGGEPLSVVLVTDESLLEEWPLNFMVRNRVPQLSLLPHLDAVVCHGGHNTVCETLKQGLPLVVLPIAYDQSYVAGLVVRTVSGIRLNFKRFKPMELRTAVWEVIRDPRYRQAAERVQGSFLKAGGVARAADLLEKAVEQGRMLLSR